MRSESARRAADNLAILVVDDDPTMRDVLEMRLQEWGFDVLLAETASEAEDLVQRKDPDLVLSDVVMPETSGIELLRRLKGKDPERPVILLTAHGTVEMTVEAMKAGALDFLTKPLDYSKLKIVLDQVQRDLQLLARSRESEGEGWGGKGFGPFVGTSTAMKEVYGLIETVAETDASALITGESGTGKELVARTVHDLSTRSNARFVALNAAAIPKDLVESELFGHERGAFTGASTPREGSFELAEGGTLFLDEIGEMPIELQPKLLRVLDEARFRRVGGKEEIKVDLRVISATNRDAREAVKEGTLREDLYYRLNVFNIHIPALREREGDISLLAEYFLDHFRRKHLAPARALRDETLSILQSYPWPGNVRELKNSLERAVILAKDEWIEPSHLPPYMRSPDASGTGEDWGVPSGLTAAEVEKRLILQTLEETENNKAETARRLGLNVKTIRNKLKSYGVDL